MSTTLQDLRERRRQIIDRSLTIQSELAASRRDWLESKGGMTHRARTALEAEFAALRLERYRMSVQVHDAERAEKSAAVARPREDWDEDDSAVLWWRFPIEEPPYVGHPNCDDWPGYHTHWTRLVIPAAAA